jgi:hypothetical protein
VPISALEFDAISCISSFGEPLLVFGAGPQRTVYGIVDQDAIVTLPDQSMQSQERVLVTVLTDEANEPYGGIRRPMLGLGIALASDPSKGYSFSGEITQANPYAHTLRFWRVVNFQTGGGVMQS